MFNENKKSIKILQEKLLNVISIVWSHAISAFSSDITECPTCNFLGKYFHEELISKQTDTQDVVGISKQGHVPIWYHAFKA